jgi:hypothetical protein
LASPFEAACDLSRPVTIVSSSTLPIPMLKHVVTNNAVKYTGAFCCDGANIALFGKHKPGHIFVDVPNALSECIKHGKVCDGHMAVGSAELVLLCGGDANLESIVRSLLCTTCASSCDMYGIAHCAQWPRMCMTACRVVYIAAKPTGSHMVVYLCELAIPHPGQAMRDARNGIIHSWLGSHTK